MTTALGVSAPPRVGLMDDKGPLTPHPFPTVYVGSTELPELPSGWMVYVDTEGSGLYGDGDPIPTGSRPAQPEARISVVSLSFRWPNPDGTPGEIRDFAWPFDQGPLVGKPGTPVKDPVTGVCTFWEINETQQAQLLANASKVLGYPVSLSEAAPNLPYWDYVELIKWLDRRDLLALHNSVHDMHTFRHGLRANAGGNSAVFDGYAKWDMDSEPGRWRPNEPQELHMMEPSNKPGRRRTVLCTMVIQKQLIAPLEPAALKKTARRLWGDDSTVEEEALKAELAKQGTGLTKRYDLLPWCGAMGSYAAADTHLGYRLYEYQLDTEEQGAVLPNFAELRDAEMILRTTLYRMERRGVAYNRTRSWAEGERLRALNVELAARMPFNPAKPAEAKRFYFGPVCSDAGDPALAVGFFCPKTCSKCEGKNGLGLEPTNRTEKTKAPQLDINELRKLTDEGRPWAAEYALWTKRRNCDSKWYTGWAARTGRDGRIRTSFRQCRTDVERPGQAAGGTVSGRLAVTRWQAQAIPHGHLIPEGSVPVRELIGDEPGYDLYEHDLATGELRVVTVVANSTKMWDALDAGADLHGMNAKAFFDVEPDHPDFKALRNGAKRGTFGVLYGGGVKAIHEQIEIATGMRFSQAKIKDAIDSFFATYPEFKRMGNQAEDKVTRWRGGCGYLTMLDGWRRWYGLSEKTNSAVNQIIQGNLARAMIYWMAEVERQLPDVLLLQIHDSLVTRHPSTPEGKAQAQQVSDIGEKVFQDFFNVRGRVMTWGIAPDRWDSKS